MEHWDGWILVADAVGLGLMVVVAKLDFWEATARDGTVFLKWRPGAHLMTGVASLFCTGVFLSHLLSRVAPWVVVSLATSALVAVVVGALWNSGRRWELGREGVRVSRWRMEWFEKWANVARNPATARLSLVGQLDKRVIVFPRKCRDIELVVGIIRSNGA